MARFKTPRPMMALALVGTVMAAAPSQAEDFFGEVEVDTTAPAEATDSPIRWLGWLQQKTAYGYREPAAGFSRDQADLTRLETQLYGQATARWQNWQARLAGSVSHDWLPDAYDADLWNGYALTNEQANSRRWQWQWADSYLSWQSGDWWLKGGYQTLAWGEAESLVVTDVLARRDQRWPGQTDLENMRLPVPAATLSWGGRIEVTLLGMTETDRYPAPYDEFDQLAAWRNQEVDVRIDDPDQVLGFAGRWQGQWPGIDAQVMAADVNNFQPALESVRFGMADGQPVVEAVELQAGRFQILGLGLQKASGSWLLKTEQAWHRGVAMATEDPLSPWPEHQQWRAMAAVEYSGIRNLTLSGELGQIHTLDWEKNLTEDRWQWSQSVRVRWTTLNDRLVITAQGIGLPGNEGLVGRLATDWQVNDSLSLGATLVDYHAWEDDQQLHPLRHNDALVLNARFGL